MIDKMIWAIILKGDEVWTKQTLINITSQKNLAACGEI